MSEEEKQTDSVEEPRDVLSSGQMDDYEAKYCSRCVHGNTDDVEGCHVTLLHRLVEAEGREYGAAEQAVLTFFVPPKGSRTRFVVGRVAPTSSA